MRKIINRRDLLKMGLVPVTLPLLKKDAEAKGDIPTTFGDCLVVYSFSETTTGKNASRVWQSLSKAQKEDTKLLSDLKPGSKIFLIPGMIFSIISPTGVVYSTGEVNKRRNENGK